MKQPNKFFHIRVRLKHEKRTHLYASVDDALYLLEKLDEIYATLNTCGVGGIYDTFHSPVDAITQMAGYIKELTRGEKS